MVLVCKLGRRLSWIFGANAIFLTIRSFLALAPRSTWMDFQLDPSVAPRLQNAAPRRWHIHFTCVIAALCLGDFEAQVETVLVVVPAYYMLMKAVNSIQIKLRNFGSETQGGARDLDYADGRVYLKVWWLAASTGNSSSTASFLQLKHPNPPHSPCWTYTCSPPIAWCCCARAGRSTACLA